MAQHKPLAGIVVCGGRSSRMGQDKCFLEYQGQPQWQYLYRMLSGLCGQAYLSVNEQQAGLFPAGLPLLQDTPAYRGKGPMSALLTAFVHLPDRGILLTGCDYPFLKQTDLEQLLQQVSAAPSLAVAFYNKQENLYEPLLAYYPPEAAAAAHKLFAAGNYSLQALLRQLDAGKYFPDHADSITSVDTPEQYQAALKKNNAETGFKKEG